MNAHLDVRTHAGEAWVSLHVQLGHAPGPLHHQLHPTFPPSPRSKNSPSRQRRRARRAAARTEKVEEASKVSEKVPATIEIVTESENAKENVSDLVNDAVETSTAVKKHVIDELCPDEVYTSSEVAESIGETSFRCFQCKG